MNEFWAGLDVLSKVLFCIALASSTILVVQIILMIIGFATGGLGDDIGMDGDVDVDGDGVPDTHDGSGVIGIITIKGIVSFFAIGCWTALGMRLGNVHVAVCLVVGIIAGAATLIGVGFLYRALYKLQSNGKIVLDNAIGKIGEVYIPIHAGGESGGKVNIVIQERLVECDARTLGNVDLETGALVKVVNVVNGELIVELAQNK